MATGRLLIATTNPAKLDEYRLILRGAGIELELVSLAELGISETPKETGATFAENALLKAAVEAFTPTVAMPAPSSVTETPGAIVTVGVLVWMGVAGCPFTWYSAGEPGGVSAVSSVWPASVPSFAVNWMGNTA